MEARLAASPAERRPAHHPFRAACGAAAPGLGWAALPAGCARLGWAARGGVPSPDAAGPLPSARYCSAPCPPPLPPPRCPSPRCQPGPAPGSRPRRFPTGASWAGPGAEPAGAASPRGAVSPRSSAHRAGWGGHRCGLGRPRWSLVLLLLLLL